MTKKQIVQYINALVGVDNMPLKYALEYFKGYQDQSFSWGGFKIRDNQFNERVFLYMDDHRNVYEVFECVNEEGCYTYNQYKLN